MGDMTAPFQPMLPTAVPTPLAADGWVHESKLDGYRCLAHVKPSRGPTVVSPRYRMDRQAP